MTEFENRMWYAFLVVNFALIYTPIGETVLWLIPFGALVAWALLRREK